MVDSFLFCFTLEGGCKFIGILNAVVSAIFLGISTIAFAINAIGGFHKETDLPLSLLILFLVLIVFSVILLYVSLQFIEGIEKRDNKMILPFYIVSMIGLVLGIFSVITSINVGFGLFVGNVVRFASCLYVCICIRSLREKLKFEDEGRLRSEDA